MHIKVQFLLFRLVVVTHLLMGQSFPSHALEPITAR